MIREIGAEEAAALAGSLTLISENLHHLARLESLAVCALAGASVGRRSVNRSLGRKLLNESLAAWVGRGDDPSETLATEAFTYNGGTHVFVAPDGESLFSLGIIAAVIVRSKRLGADYLRAANGLIQGICAISDLIVERVGLCRNAPGKEYQMDISVPSERDLRLFMGAVRITKSEKRALMSRTVLTPLDLDALSAMPGKILLPDPPYATTRLINTPILRARGGDLIVLAPHRLVEAGVRRLLDMAADMGMSAVLAEECHLQICHSVNQNLLRLGLRQSNVPPLQARTQLKNSFAEHALYQCDQDKIIHLALFTDALNDSARGDDVWETEELERELHAASDTLNRALAESEPPTSAWMSVVVIGSLGRDHVLYQSHGKDVKRELLLFHASELETLVIAEGADCSPLLLWKYARALRELESRCTVVSWAPLDLYALWRDRGRAFPMGVNVMSILPSFGTRLRERAVKRYDWHAIPSRTPGSMVEVGIADAPEQPIFVPRHRSGRVEIAVERPAGFIWVVSTDELGEARPDSITYMEIGRMISFWISEFSRVLVTEFTSLGAGSEVIVVEYKFLTSNDDEPAPSSYHITQLPPAGIQISIHPRFIERYDDSNSLERRFAADVVRAVLGLGASSGVGSAVEEALAVVAPVGVKRMMHRVHTGEWPEFIAAEYLSRPRFPHAADLILVHRRVLQTSPLSRALTSSQESAEWLNVAVGGIYKELRGILAGYEGGDMLRRLLENNEALVYEDALHKMTLASQLACYLSVETVYDRLLEDVPRRAAASIATRFLVEHVVAEPPLGSRLLNDLEFDWILALAHQIVTLGMASDVARFELAAVRVRINEGDLVVDRGTYEEAGHGSLRALTREEVARESVRDRVRSCRVSPREVDQSEFLKDLDIAVSTEFGVSLTQLALVFGEAIALAQDNNAIVVKVLRSAFVRRLVESLPMHEGEVESALRALTLEPRPKYVTAPPGFDSNDIWPWRFNRGLSYVRRPFVLVQGVEGVELWFTPGHMHRASRNLIALITSGRLKARSKILAQVMGKFTEESSNVFNENVVRVLRERGFVVLSQVAKIGRERITDPSGNSLGDIDVLCLDVVKRRVIAIECKDFEMARAPHEVRCDQEALFVSVSGRRSAQEKHLRRVDWLRQHVTSVVSFMGGDSTVAGWTVEGAFVFSSPLISPLLGRASIPVWTLHEIANGQGP